VLAAIFGVSSSLGYLLPAIIGENLGFRTAIHTPANTAASEVAEQP
jgi:hypothetical protein